MQTCVKFDFQISFPDGSTLKGHDFCLTLLQDDVADEVLAEFLVIEMRLPRVRRIQIYNKEVARRPVPRHLLADFTFEPNPELYKILTCWAALFPYQLN